MAATTMLSTVNDSPVPAADRSMWRRLEELIDCAPNLAALRAHRLELAAARIWRSRGLSAPPDLRRRQQQAAVIRVGASQVLERVRTVYDGRLMLMKGPEVAARYEHPADRWFRDLDILADDPPAAQRALIQAGFVEIADPAYYEDKQHHCPLMLPGIPVLVELHRRPNTPRWLPQVDALQILERGVPSATGISGLLAPTPAAHALLLCAHSFAHGPMRKLRDIVDVAAVVASGGRDEAEALSREWGWGGLWRISREAVDAVLSDGDVPRSLRVLGGHLLTVRERTVFENHVARTAAPIYALPNWRVPWAVASVLMLDTVGPADSESWGRKLRRSRSALAHAFMTTTAHEQTVPGTPEPVETADPIWR
jgi:hypothetical protein